MAQDPNQISPHVRPCSTCRFVVPVDRGKDPGRNLAICLVDPPRTMVVGKDEGGSFVYHVHPNFTYGHGCARHEAAMLIDLEVKLAARSPI